MQPTICSCCLDARAMRVFYLRLPRNETLPSRERSWRVPPSTIDRSPRRSASTAGARSRPRRARSKGAPTVAVFPGARRGRAVSPRSRGHEKIRQNRGCARVTGERRMQTPRRSWLAGWRSMPHENARPGGWEPGRAEPPARRRTISGGGHRRLFSAACAAADARACAAVPAEHKGQHDKNFDRLALGSGPLPRAAS